MRTRHEHTNADTKAHTNEGTQQRKTDATNHPARTHCQPPPSLAPTHTHTAPELASRQGPT